jgi:hypothetical protein
LKATEKNVESRFSKDFSRIPVHGASLEGDEKAEQHSIFHSRCRPTLSVGKIRSVEVAAVVMEVKRRR